MLLPALLGCAALAAAVLGARLARARATVRTRESLFFDHSPQAMWVFDRETLRFLAVNDAAVASYGYSREEFLAMTIADIRPPEDVPLLLASLDRSGARAGSRGVYRHRKRSGEVIDVEVVAHDVELGGRAARLVHAYDVTARLRTEDRLRRRTERLAAIVEAQQEIAAATLSLEEALPRLLERARSVTGADGAAIGHAEGDDVVFDVVAGEASVQPGSRTRSAASLAGAALRTWELERCDDSDADPRVDREAVRRLGYRSVVTLPLVYGGETVGILLAGARRPGAFGEEETHALHLFGGMLSAAMSHARELAARQRTIVERTAALEALRDREEQLRTVTDGVPALIAYVDAAERYRFVNAAYEVVLRFPRSEILGRTVADLLGEKAYAHVRPWIRAALGGRQVSYELDLELPHGRRRHSAVTYVPHRSDAGAVVGFYSISTDLTEHDLLEDQLRQAQKMEAVGTLAGGVAHDFNNLLTVISTITRIMLERADLAAEQREDLDEIRRAADGAAELTRKLLAFGRRQTLQPRVLDLNAVVLDAQKMLRRLVREDIQLVCSLAPGPCFVFADSAQLEQVLVNLVGNARDAMPRGGTVAVETEVVESGPASLDGAAPGGAQVRLAVRDDGEGMSRDVVARAFEPFFTTKPPGHGTGLGLASVYGIAKQSGGSASIESAPGRGTTVTVVLPRVEAPIEPAVEAKAPREAAGGCETILLVEDEASVRLVARRVLEDRGYRVVCAGDGAEALSVAERGGPIDLLLTDVVMPRMGGRELARRLETSRPGLPVLFMSGHVADDGGHAGMLTTPLPFLQKPFTPETLARAIRGALDAGPPRATTSPAAELAPSLAGRLPGTSDR